MARSVAAGMWSALLVCTLSGFAAAGPEPVDPPSVAAAPEAVGTLVASVRNLGDLGGGSYGQAVAVDGDRIVGWAYAPGGAGAFVYDLDAATPYMVQLADFGRESFAGDIDGDIVVGTAYREHYYVAFAYDLGASQPRMLNLGKLGGRWSAPSAVDDGVVVGLWSPKPDRGRAFVYDLEAAEPSMFDLGAVLGRGQSEAADVEDGIVVGQGPVGPDGDHHAFAYDLRAAEPEVVDLGTLGGTYSSARAIEGGVVVGEASTAHGRILAFAYDLRAAEPTMVNLGALGRSDSSAYAVDAGVVVGTSRTDGEYHSYAYDLRAAEPTMVDLGTLGGGTTLASAVEGGVVVGSSETAAGYSSAFAYDLRATEPRMVDLGALGGPTSGAAAIDEGVIVGMADLPFRDTHAAMWTLSSTTGPVLRFSRLTYSAKENQGVATITVERTGDASTAVSVGYKVRHAGDAIGRRAKKDQDFTPGRGTVAFAAGQTTASFTVPIIDDATAEHAEKLALLLTVPTGGAAVGTPRAAALSIKASDQRPDVLIRTGNPIEKGASPLLGDNIYNTTAAHQTQTTTGRRGGTRTFTVQIHPDRFPPAKGRFHGGPITLHAGPPRADMTARYFRAGVNVTEAMRSTRGLKAWLSHEHHLRVEVRITIEPDAATGARKAATVTTTWNNDRHLSDRVRAVVRVAP